MAAPCILLWWLWWHWMLESHLTARNLQYPRWNWDGLLLGKPNMIHPEKTPRRPRHIEVHIAVPRAGDQQAPFPVHRQCLRGFVRAGSNPSGSWAAVSFSRLQLVIWDFSCCDDVVIVVAFLSVPLVPITENVGHVGTWVTHSNPVVQWFAAKNNRGFFARHPAVIWMSQKRPAASTDSLSHPLPGSNRSETYNFRRNIDDQTIMYSNSKMGRKNGNLPAILIEDQYRKGSGPTTLQMNLSKTGSLCHIR